MWYSYLYVDNTSDLHIQKHESFEDAAARAEEAIGPTSFCKWFSLVFSPKGGISYATWRRPSRKVCRWINPRRGLYLQAGEQRPPRQRGWEEQEISILLTDEEMTDNGYHLNTPGLRQISIFSKNHMKGQIAAAIALGNDRSQDIAAMERAISSCSKK